MRSSVRFGCLIPSITGILLIFCLLRSASPAMALSTAQACFSWDLSHMTISLDPGMSVTYTGSNVEWLYGWAGPEGNTSSYWFDDWFNTNAGDPTAQELHYANLPLAEADSVSTAEIGRVGAEAYAYSSDAGAIFAAARSYVEMFYTVAGQGNITFSVPYTVQIRLENTLPGEVSTVGYFQPPDNPCLYYWTGSILDDVGTYTLEYSGSSTCTRYYADGGTARLFLAAGTTVSASSPPHAAVPETSPLWLLTLGSLCLLMSVVLARFRS